MRIPNFNINRKKKKKVWMLKIAIHSNIIDIKIYWIQNKKNERASKFLRYKFVRWSKNIEPSLFEASHWTTGHGPLHAFFSKIQITLAPPPKRGTFRVFSCDPPSPESQYSIRLFTMRTMASNPILLVVTKVTTIPWERCWQNSRFPTSEKEGTMRSWCWIHG